MAVGLICLTTFSAQNQSIIYWAQGDNMSLYTTPRPCYKLVPAAQRWELSELVLLGGAVVLNGESAGVSSQSLARWPLRLQVMQICRNLHETGYTQRPLFQEVHMRSSISGLAVLFPATGPPEDVAGCLICCGGCSDARAQCVSE